MVPAKREPPEVSKALDRHKGMVRTEPDNQRWDFDTERRVASVLAPAENALGIISHASAAIACLHVDG